MRQLDYGKGYRYAHDEPDAFAAGERYLPGFTVQLIQRRDDARGISLVTGPGSTLQIDRTDITAKIKARYYDLIIYGSIWRAWDLLSEVISSYQPEQIIFIDGEVIRDRTRLSDPVTDASAIHVFQALSGG